LWHSALLIRSSMLSYRSISYPFQLGSPPTAYLSQMLGDAKTCGKCTISWRFAYEGMLSPWSVCLSTHDRASSLRGDILYIVRDSRHPSGHYVIEHRSLSWTIVVSDLIIVLILRVSDTVMRKGVHICITSLEDWVRSNVPVMWTLRMCL